MAEKKLPSRYNVGDKVRVRSGVSDPGDFPGDEYRLFCQARRDNERVELPLTEVEVRKGNPNQRLLADYSYWFVNW